MKDIYDGNKSGLAPRCPVGEYPVSRDWKDIDCKTTVCQNNISGKCAVPSICSIGEDGTYSGFSIQFSKENK